MNRIKEVLKEEGVQVKELATRLGVSRQALSCQLNGNLRVDTAQRIADMLHVPMWRLFASDEEALSDIRARHEEYCPHCGERL